MILLDKSIKEEIKEQAFNEMPNECCGLIIESGKYKSYKCKNISQEKNKSFKISPVDYVNASNLGKIKAVYHSHPEGNADLSPLDLINTNHGLEVISYSVEDDRFETSLKNNYLDILLDKNYIEGENDCITLVEKYYDLFLNIDLNLSHEKIMQCKSLISLIDYTKNKNLFPIEDGAVIDRGDIILLDKKENEKFPAHVCIYLGCEKIIWHPFNKKSRIDNYDRSFFQKNTISILRHYE